MARNTVGESSTTLHLIVKAQLNVIVEPDLMVADFGSNAEFTCKAYHKDGPDDDGQGEKDYLASCHTAIKLRYSESTIPQYLLHQKEIVASRLRLFNVRVCYPGIDIEKIVDLWTFFNIEKEILENSDMIQSQSHLTSISLLMNGLSFT